MKRERDKDVKSEPCSKRRKEAATHQTKTPTTFLSLPRGLRQQILFAVYDDDKTHVFELHHAIRYYIPKIGVFLHGDSVIMNLFTVLRSCLQEKLEEMVPWVKTMQKVHLDIVDDALYEARQWLGILTRLSSDVNKRQEEWAQ